MKNGAITTNDKDASILMGVTRASVLEIARDLGIEANGRPDLGRRCPERRRAVLHRHRGRSHRRSARWTARVIGDGKPGPITRRIQETFNQAVRGELPQYRRWLSFVRQAVRA